ncbi:MAG TPA: glycosyltransferase family 2 protein [Sphingomicrobium sp.]|jgi:cellulose synthase/poly-beta-1,6-N-acetylglucosamine synthase-like glycosyltransferase|nr:glycosyltransferase family 2 protein [Sphingomicrobium sp.]
MKTIFFFVMAASALLFFLIRLRRRPSTNLMSVEVIVPAFNEEPVIEQSLINLLRNRYVKRVICVNDGSTDRTAEIVTALTRRTPRLLLVNQSNSGKGAAIMNGLRHVEAPQVFLTDADTYVPYGERGLRRGNGLGYMLAEIEAGADAVGGVPSSDLRAGELLAYVRATVKMPMIVVKRTFQQIFGGAPFIISGSCGMFRTEVLREVGMTDRTNVEDLDLTWTLVARGYKVRQVNRAVVYPQECKTIREEWRRWRRWIMGYAVCMRLHSRLLLSRYGLFSILPMFLVVVLGVGIYGYTWTRAVMDGGHALPALMFPALWLLVVCCLGGISALHHRKFRLMPMAPLALLYVLIAYVVWVVHGFASLITGHEFNRDKPTRYYRVVA